jgi:hypothetical protein
MATPGRSTTPAARRSASSILLPLSAPSTTSPPTWPTAPTPIGFPNPFVAANWGFPGDQHQPAEAERIRYAAVERPLLGERNRALPDQLRTQAQWRTVLDRQGIIVLEPRPQPGDAVPFSSPSDCGATAPATARARP